MNKQESQRLRLKAGAGFLGISPETLASPRWRRKYGVPAFKVGKALVFDSDELAAWLRSRREGAKAA